MSTSLLYWEGKHLSQHSRFVSPALSRGEGSPPLTYWKLFFLMQPASCWLRLLQRWFGGSWSSWCPPAISGLSLLFCLLSACWLPVCAPEQQSFAFSFVEVQILQRLAHFCSLSTSLWVAAGLPGLLATTSNTVSLSSFLRVDSLLSPIIFPLQRI